MYNCYDFALHLAQIRLRNCQKAENPTPDPDSGIITALVTDSRNPLAQTRMKPVKEVRKYCGFPHHHPPLARNGCKGGQDSLDTTLILEQP